MAARPVNPLPRRQADQYGLGLIVERVGGEDMRSACFARGLGEQPVAQPRALSPDARRGLAAVPAQRAMRDA